jgi:hypothetical protein
VTETRPQRPAGAQPPTKQLSTFPVPQGLDQVRGYAELFFASGMFKDTASIAQAAIKIQAGAEVGVPPFAAMMGIHIIKDKPTFGANLLAAKVKGSGKYDYRVTEMTDEVVSIDFFQGTDKLGASPFTMKEAKAAGLLSNPSWQKYPRNMLFARAVSNGIKWYCSDVLSGGTFYTPEEMGAEVDENGDVLAAPAAVTPKPEPAPSVVPTARRAVENRAALVEPAPAPAPELVPLVRKPRTITPHNIFEEGPNVWRLPATVASDKGAKDVDLYIRERAIQERLGKALAKELTWDVLIEWEGPGVKGRAFIVQIIGDGITAEARIEQAMAASKESE